MLIKDNLGNESFTITLKEEQTWYTFVNPSFTASLTGSFAGAMKDLETVMEGLKHCFEKETCVELKDCLGKTALQNNHSVLAIYPLVPVEEVAPSCH